MIGWSPSPNWVSIIATSVSMQHRFISSTARTCWRRWRRPASITVFKSIQTHLTPPSTLFPPPSTAPPLPIRRRLGPPPTARRPSFADTFCARSRRSYTLAAGWRPPRRHRRTKTSKKRQPVERGILKNFYQNCTACFPASCASNAVLRLKLEIVLHMLPHNSNALARTVVDFTTAQNHLERQNYNWCSGEEGRRTIMLHIVILNIVNKDSF